MLVVSTPSRWRTGVTYRYSASRLAHGEGLLQAVEQTPSLEHELRREGG